MKPKFVKARIYVMIRGKVATVLRPHKIKIIKENEGIIVSDGRPVKLINGIWIYEAIP